jgi:hypothetical protein
VTVHRTWGDYFLWGYGDIPKYLEGLSFRMNALSIHRLLKFRRVPRPLRAVAAMYVEKLPLGIVDGAQSLGHGAHREGPDLVMRPACTAAALLVGLVAAACGRTLSPAARAEPGLRTETFLAEIRLGHPAGPVNRRILGSNVQWVDRGDALLAEDGSQFDPEMLELVGRLGPTVLRYPGGALAVTFDWRAGNGPIHRGSSEHFHTRQRQRVLFGTAELLALCRRVGAEPLITVNVAAALPTTQPTGCAPSTV